MKKNLLIVLLPLLLVGCSKDFLTKENPNKIESEYYFSNENSLILYSNGLVRSFSTAIKSFIDGDKYADTQVYNGQYLYYTDLYTADDASNWKASNWSRLRSVNYFLENLRKADASSEVLDHYEGVGRFFRAMFYFDKVKVFGAVPWYDHLVDPQNPDDIYRARDNREEVCRHILEDLDYACTHCSGAEKYRDRAGYINKWVALALKVRFCLYEGTYRKYHTVDPSTGAAWQSDESKMYLDACIAAAEELMASGLYSLTDDPAKRRTQYRDMFTAADGCGDYANEFIWARDYDLSLGVNNTDFSINDYMTNSAHANYGFVRAFINTYLMQDGTPFTSKYPAYDNVDFATECKDRDFRLSQTIRTPGFTRDGGMTTWAPDIMFAKTGYQPIKWLTDDSSKDPLTAATATDVPLIRYAEVLISYAEAMAEEGKCDEAVWNKTVKPLRERSGVKSIFPLLADPYMVDYFQGQITDPVLLEIRRERGVEFPLEDIRLDDIMRWHQGDLISREWKGIYIPASETELDLNGDGKAETYVSAVLKEKLGFKVLPIDGISEAGHKLSNGTSGNIVAYTAIPRVWRDYKYVHPIPADAMLQNKNLQQNPNW